MLADCGGTDVQEEPERFAFLPPDNQTGDASLDWATQVIHRGMAAELGESISTNTAAESRLSSKGPNRIVYSTLTRAEAAGEVRLHSVIFEANGHQFVREFTVTGNVLQAINRMATSIHSQTNPLGANSEEVLKKWPVLAGGNVADYETKCLDLAESDPAFGAALGSCAEQLTASGRTDALRGLLSRVQPEQARQFTPDVLETFGNSYMALKQYSDAAVMFRNGAVGRPTIANILGYAEALSGRCDASKLALEEYSRVPGQEPNALDSLGETSFFCGKFKEAEQYFQAASTKLMGTPQGELEPWKAAAARAMSGDEAGANQMANALLEKLGKSNPQAQGTYKALWSSITNARSGEERQRAIEQTLIHRP